MKVKFKKGELKLLVELEELLHDAGLLDENVSPFKDAYESDPVVKEFEISDDILKLLADEDGNFKFLDFMETDHMKSAIDDITPDSRGYLPITSKEELRKAAEEEPLSIFLRPIKCDSYAVIDIMLYGYHGYLTAAVDKDKEIIKPYDIRFPRKPEIRLDDLTEEEIDAVMTPWVTPGVFKDSRFSMNRLATLGEAREWMIESFKSTRNLVIHSSEFCGSTELDPPEKSRWRKVNPYPRGTDKYKEWEERKAS